MKIQVISFLLPLSLFAQSVSQLGVSPDLLSGTDSLFNANPYGAGRGANVADLDGDGKKEVWITSYTKGGRVFCFEETTDGTMAFVWASPELVNTDYGTTPRDIGFGDMDGDGNLEVIFHIGRYNDTTSTSANTTDNGIYVYENTADNLYDNVFHANMLTALNDSLYESRVEGFTVADLDADGKHEILLASNGASGAVYGTQDGSTAYSEDRYIVMGMTGSIGGALQDAALKHQEKWLAHKLRLRASAPPLAGVKTKQYRYLEFRLHQGLSEQSETLSTRHFLSRGRRRFA